jgi:hypothetical protein
VEDLRKSTLHPELLEKYLHTFILKKTLDAEYYSLATSGILPRYATPFGPRTLFRVLANKALGEWGTTRIALQKPLVSSVKMIG